MEVVLGQFAKALTNSGLMTAEEVDSFIEGLPADNKPDDGKTLAQPSTLTLCQLMPQKLRSPEMEHRTAELLLAVLIVAVTYTVCAGRAWTDRKGRQVEAEYIAFEEGKVRIKRISDGKLFDIPLENLSDVDQAFIKSKHREALPAEQGKVKIARNGDKSQPPPAIAPFSPEQAKQHQKAWADHLKVPVEFKNSIGMKMVLIPPGEFMMGSPDSDPDARGHEKPQHRVRITKPFEMAAHEVTVGQFRAFVETTGYKTEAETAGGDSNWTNSKRFEQTDEHPVVWVSWNDAVAFCEWLSEKDGNTYRLPSEAEWEYACRSGSTTRWYFGDSESDLKEYAWYNVENRIIFNGNGTKPVAQKLPNGFGLLDMHGNARELCSDWFSPPLSPVQNLLKL